jgi:hypothetical protein
LKICNISGSALCLWRKCFCAVWDGAGKTSTSAPTKKPAVALQKRALSLKT